LILLFVLPCVSGMTICAIVPSHRLRWGPMKFFCPYWPQISILLISASQVARIIGLSHHAWPFFFLRQCLTMEPRLAVNYGSSSLSLLSAGIAGMYHHVNAFFDPQYFQCMGLSGCNTIVS
jgi:hypothetical protein